jgi:hypothetical protein
MKRINVRWLASILLGAALALPPALLAAEKKSDMMKDDKGMMKDDKAAKSKKDSGKMMKDDMKMESKSKNMMDEKKK